MTDRLLIANARMVNEGVVSEGDLLIGDGRIARPGGSLSASGAVVIDAAGRVLMPGMIDSQVHFREPGVTHKGDIASESRAAIAGYWADLVLVDTHAPLAVARDKLLYKCGWSPLEGRTLRSRVYATLVNGRLKYMDGGFFGSADGMRLEFMRG